MEALGAPNLCVVEEYGWGIILSNFRGKSWDEDLNLLGCPKT